MFKDKEGRHLSKAEVISKGYNRILNILLEFDIFLLHIAGHFPSHTLRTLAYRIAGIKLGKGSTLHMGARFYDPRNIIIGDDTIIGERATLDGRDILEIGSHVDIASEVMIYNSEHDINETHFAPKYGHVIIEDYVFVGPRAIILAGVRVGKGAVIAAGAVVTKDVEPFAVVGGVPAKVIGERKDKDLHYKLGRARWFR